MQNKHNDMISKKESIEDYLEKILMLKKEQEVVRAIDIARFMNFSKPSLIFSLPIFVFHCIAFVCVLYYTKVRRWCYDYNNHY